MRVAPIEKLKTVLRVTSGNFLEMYDFFCSSSAPDRLAPAAG